MRVWEVAYNWAVESQDVLDWLRANGEWVPSHLSVVPATHMERMREDLNAREVRAEPGPEQHRDQQPESQIPTPQAPPLPGRPTLRRPGLRPIAHAGPRPGMTPEFPKRRRPPGPAPVTYRRTYDPNDAYSYDRYRDPLRALRYQQVLPTRDVADLCGVSTATVRQWVSRGHLTPAGKDGPSHVFETREVLRVSDTIARRRSRLGEPKQRLRRTLGGRRPVTQAELARLARVRPGLVLTTAEAAGLLGLKPATIRSWVRRGTITPQPSSSERRLEFRPADLLAALGHRHVAQ